ncbi:hypothetical protein [Sphingomonas immobilis]|uniref:Uncharacterized protein n=1 Tax=Sphingomonas immobilis TaxID=3063997 RepID=A0ABT9A4B8_9SPHN|nr:hypothetical protein [Sphingomonas sp. CA1-15]MDO7844688.1 hypothetical protein [Sphingomonas sp. CA1-15]
MNILKVLGITVFVMILAVLAAPFVLGVTAVALIGGSREGRAAIEMSRAEQEMEKARQASGTGAYPISDQERVMREVIAARADAERREGLRQRDYAPPADYKPGEPMSSTEPTR